MATKTVSVASNGHVFCPPWARRKRENMDEITAIVLQNQYVVLTLLLVHFLVYGKTRKRKEKLERFAALYRERGDYFKLSWQLRAEGEFEQYHRMTPEAFEGLLRLIGGRLTVDEAQSRRRTSTAPLTPAAKLLMTLSWLAGGAYHHIRVIAGVSRAYFYSCVYDVMRVLCTCEELALCFPSSRQQLHRAADGFRLKSENGVLRWRVAAIDGWLLRVRAPPKKRVANVSSFFSGRYKSYGLNVQFSVDSQCMFTSFSIKAPGGTNDIVAFTRSRMCQLISALPPGFFAVGDAAYPLMTTLMTPYSGASLNSRPRDNYNYAVSQLRIRAEMTLGLFTNKFRIFDRHLSHDLRNVGLITHTGMRVHNYVIGETLRGLDDEEAEEWLQEQAGVPEVDALDLEEAADDAEEGAEAVREAWVQRVLESGVVRR
eukprot:GHVU01052821.1.p1 GENE.GHVU01052821.1~~GHVU01052821.1.p1  ORF type:complete len:428 (+),score=45.72 GHVU01052821.1:125-1408(+)